MLSCVTWRGALDSSGVLLSCPVTLLASSMTNILISAHIYIRMQFPNKTCLPDCEGKSDLPALFSADNPLLPAHARVSPRESAQLDKIDTYDRLKVAELLALADSSTNSAGKFSLSFGGVKQRGHCSILVWWCFVPFGVVL